VALKAPHLRELSDEELMSRYVLQDEAAFEVLLSRYRKPLFGFLYRYLGRTDKAEDVFQDVFFEVIRARKRYRADSRFAAWLYRIARNRAVDRLRRDGFRDMESLDDPLHPNDPDSATRVSRLKGDVPDPEALVRDRQVHDVLEDVLSQLPVEQREVFWLKERAGLSITEIAEISGVSPNTVKSRLRYALEKIRADLDTRGFKP
jgi:RNA polymerase sigma-70 factor, ECF subfamily